MEEKKEGRGGDGGRGRCGGREKMCRKGKDVEEGRRCGGREKMWRKGERESRKGDNNATRSGT